MKKFPYKPPQKPASGKVEYVPLVEAAVSGPVGIARFGAKSIAGQIAQVIPVSNESAKILKKAHENKGKGVEGLKNIFFKKGGKMPLKKSSGKGKAAMQKAVSANIQELTRANREKPAGKKRSKEQIAAIAYSAARKK
jgi:hypothetical protein